MDDSEHLCPLCCEELDLSDREFYPCKCGYQVCMWCWHRIRETESGLCPACRTPYGEDPHQFSAVDVDTVLKANKEKEAAAKRDRALQRSSSHHHPGTGGPAVPHQQHPPDNLHRISPTAEELHNEAAMEIPKDRMSLANMRVIRRNLVYAVGLPPGIASEDALRKPEYFGQYGRIAKIVMNRTQASDPRRASTSAYVTFVHKEDTLACILALDGFHMDGRNVRASYGTSKYCSAFIKNVRCNNPDCTYLHEMGAAEDTFTKQEIQAGYVTSGRDVLARQQQIVAEQLRLAGSNGSAPRKRVGGGGPSGTGKASVHPILPAPEFDEPTKPNHTLVPPPAGLATRSSTAGTNVPTVSLTARPAARAASVGNKSPGSGPVPAMPSVAVASLPPQRKAVSAASVVAGVHTISAPRAEPPEPHTTLTPLTPLKRSSKASRAAGDGTDKLTPVRGAAKKKNGVTSASSAQANSLATTTSSSMSIPTLNSGAAPVVAVNGAAKTKSSSIGGEPIGPPSQSSANDSGVSRLDAVGGEINSNGNTGPSSLLGGDVFTGQLPSSSRTAIGSGKDKWGSVPSGAGGLSHNDNAQVAAGPPSGDNALWNGSRAAGAQNLAPGPPAAGLAGGVIGSRAPGQATGGNSSSALASILGISLPTGSGSLQESTNLWTSTTPAAMPVTPSPLSSLNNGSMPVQGSSVIGGAPVGLGGGGSSLIGGVPIGMSGGSSFDSGTPGTIGGGGSGGNGKSDIALLQSLLPGVHITSGSSSSGFGTIGSWNGRSGPSSLNGDAIVGGSGSWGSVSSEQGSSSAVGTIGGNAIPQQNQRGPGIW